PYVSLMDINDICPQAKVSFYRLEARYYDNKLIAHRNRSDTVRPGHCSKRGRGTYTGDVSDWISAYKIDSNMTVAFHDSSGSLVERLKLGFADKKVGERVLAFRIDSREVDKEAVFKKIKALLGNPTKVVTSSELPRPVRVVSKKGKITPYVFKESRSNNRYAYRGESRWKFEQTKSSLVDFSLPNEKRYLYIPLNGKSVSFPGSGATMSPNSFVEYLKMH